MQESKLALLNLLRSSKEFKLNGDLIHTDTVRVSYATVRSIANEPVRREDTILSKLDPSILSEYLLHIYLGVDYGWVKLWSWTNSVVAQRKDMFCFISNCSYQLLKFNE